ncbi:MAG: hypothetical protein GC145_06160 [Caulobacter sp.]|nr:hypothetical protein [Caulobacter sp.]
MSDIAVTWAKAQKCPSARAKSTLVHLAAYCDAEGEGWAAVAVLALEMEVDERTVQRGLAALRKEGLIAETGETKAYRGRRVPYYRLALDQGPANTRQRMALERGTGDTDVTPRVTVVSPDGCQPCHPTGDTDVTQIGKINTSTEAERFANAHLSEDARASDDVAIEEAAEPSDAFRTAFAAWPATGAAATAWHLAWDAWQTAVAEAGDEARLLACVQAFAADPLLKRRTYGAGAMQRWLKVGGWRSYVERVEAAATARAAVPGARFIGPASIRDLVAGGLGETGAARTIDPAGWDAERRVVLPRTGWAFDQIRPLRPADADWTIEHPREQR